MESSSDRHDRLFAIAREETRFCACSAVAAERYACQRAILAPAALEASLLRDIARFDATDWTSDLHPLGDFLTEASPRVARAVELLLVRPAMLRWLETVTGCGPLAKVSGHVAKTLAKPNHRLRWHNDLNVPQRRLAITVNLGTAAYDGGVFELRDVASQKTLFRHVHRGPGDVLIFEVSSRSEHRVTPITAGGPRLVFAGWFFAALRDDQAA